MLHELFCMHDDENTYTIGDITNKNGVIIFLFLLLGDVLFNLLKDFSEKSWNKS